MRTVATGARAVNVSKVAEPATVTQATLCIYRKRLEVPTRCPRAAASGWVGACRRGGQPCIPASRVLARGKRGFSPLSENLTQLWLRAGVFPEA